MDLWNLRAAGTRPARQLRQPGDHGQQRSFGVGELCGWLDDAWTILVDTNT